MKKNTGNKSMMASKYQHFVLTQFNLRNFPKSKNSEYKKWLEWTRERVQLFEKYCLPSVLNQTESNFTWILYFDEETPEEFSDFIDRMNSYTNIAIHFCNGADGFQNGYMEAVKSRLAKGVEWVVTSRMDNDDCVHKDMVKNIQRNIQFKHGFLVSLASGYALKESTKKMAHYYYPMSPFLTIVEQNDSANGIFEKGHTVWPELRLWIYKELWTEWFASKSRMVRFVLNKPMWVQVIHQTNVSNSFHRGLPVLNEKKLVNFGLDVISKASHVREISKYANYVIWKRYLKCTIIKFLLKH